MVRRYDTMFDRVRQTARYSRPYEPTQLTKPDATAIAELPEPEEPAVAEDAAETEATES
jgi:hypothetical protein